MYSPFNIPRAESRACRGTKSRGLTNALKISMRKPNWKWYVYIIECVDGFYYTGLTWSPSIRWEQHLSGLGSKFTSRHKPKKLVYLEEFEDLEVARRREKQIKNWRRAKKEKLINGQWGRDW